jgi:hypothetical protein
MSNFIGDFFFEKSNSVPQQKICLFSVKKKEDLNPAEICDIFTFEG